MVFPEFSRYVTQILAQRAFDKISQERCQRHGGNDRHKEHQPGLQSKLVQLRHRFVSKIAMNQVKRV